MACSFQRLIDAGVLVSDRLTTQGTSGSIYSIILIAGWLMDHPYHRDLPTELGEQFLWGPLDYME